MSRPGHVVRSKSVGNYRTQGQVAFGLDKPTDSSTDIAAARALPTRKSKRVALTGLEGDYVSGAPTKTVSGIDVQEFTHGSLSCTVAVTGVPQSFTYQLWFSNDGGVSYHKKSDTYWANNILDDTSLVLQGSRLFQFDCSGVDFIQFVFIAAGTGAATPKFTVSDCDAAFWVA